MGLGLGLAGFAPAAEMPSALTDVPPQTQHGVRSETARLMPLIPQAPSISSPVAQFRHLLDLPPRERENYLTNRPPEIRAALRAKIQEYLAMDPDSRELRLRATELRYQLIPLLRLPPGDRAPRLAQVPEDLAPLVQSRLAEWDKLSPALQQEFLANNRTLPYFAVVDTANQQATAEARAEHQRIAEQFNHFFELTPDEKQRTLKTISVAERAQMEAALEAFGKLSPPQRRQCIQAFTKFAELSPAERTEFIRNAERWAQMTPKERQTWRDLVARVPEWPPLPPNFIMPPLPPRVHPPVKAHPQVATNRN
jgi:hypothetical protein